MTNGHEKDCRFRLASTCAVGICCDHGYDVCPICDPCTCPPNPLQVLPPTQDTANEGDEMTTTTQWKTDVRAWARANGFYGAIIDDAISEAVSYAEADAESGYAIDWLLREREEQERDGRLQPWRETCHL